MVNLFLAMNPDLSATIRFPISQIKQKLDSLYDVEFINYRDIEALTAPREGSDDDSDDEVALRLSQKNFKLPYAEYRELIEAHAVPGGKDISIPPSPSNNRDLPPTLSQSTKAESIDVPTQSEHADQDDQEDKQPPPPTPAPVKGRRKRASTLAKEKSTTKVRKNGSVNGSAGTGTPGKETEEENEESNAGSTTRGGSKRQRVAPPRKSSRKK